MDKNDKINEAIPDDREPEKITVSVGDETYEWKPDDPEVDDLVITGGGGVFVIEDDFVYRYGPSSVEEIVYQNTGYEDLAEHAEEADEEGSDDGQ